MKVWERIQQEQIQSRQQALDALMRRVREIARGHGVRVFPFGSYADGRVDATSDFDVAFSGDLSRTEQLGIIKALEAASRESGIEIDMVFEAETPGFFREVRHACRVQQPEAPPHQPEDRPGRTGDL